MNQRKRVFAMALAVVLALGVFAGCGGKDAASTDSAASSGRPGGAGAAATSADYVYVASYAPLTVDDGGELNIGNSCIAGDTIYFTAYSYTSVDPAGNVLTEEDEDYWEYYQSSQSLYRAPLEGGTASKLTDYVSQTVPEGSEGSADIRSISADVEGDLWVLEDIYSYHFDAPDGVTRDDEEYWDYYVDDGEQFFLRKLDQNGAELKSVDLSAFVSNQSEEGTYISSMITDAEDRVYLLLNWNELLVLDAEGNQLFKLDSNYGFDSLIRFSDGGIGVSGYQESGYIVQRVDPQTKALTDTYKLPVNCYNVYSGGGDTLFFCGNNSSLFGVSAQTGEAEKLLNWLDCDVDSESLNGIAVRPDGSIVTMLTSWDTDYSTRSVEMLTLTRTPASEVTQKTVLTYACVYLDWGMRSKILEFNKTNEKYRIEVLDYSEYNTDEDWSAGQTKLTTEIVSGNVPDLLSTSDLPIDRYAAKGLLEDLYPYIDKDPELSRDSFVASVLRAMETDGKLYELSDSFGVFTVIGDPNRIGPEPGWTMADLLKLMADQPEGTDVFDKGMTRDDMLHTAMTFTMADFVDWQTGECRFDSEDFVNLLEFCASFPSSFDWESYEWTEEDDTPNRVMTGKQLLVMTSLYDFEEFQMYEAMFGGNIVYKGFPCSSGVGNALMVQNGIAMTTSCSDKEGAWEFIKFLMTTDSRYSWYFPTNKAAFDKMLTEAMTPEYYTDPETGERTEVSKGGYGWGSLDIEIYAITQEQADSICAMIDSVDRLYNYDEEIFNIIQDECAAFFNGEKSAQQTADLIQSRVRLYVNEQR